MSYLNQAEAVDAIATTDRIAVFDSSKGDTRQATVAQLIAWIQSNVASPSNALVRQAVPVTATGYTVSVLNTGEWVWLFVTLPGDLSAGTLVFPANPVDQQELWIYRNYATTTTTVDGQGYTVSMPDTAYLGIAGLLKFKFDAQTATWYG